MFLPGNHHLQVTVNITNVSDVVLRRERNDDIVYIQCKIDIAIHREGVINTVEGLKFVLNSEVDREMTAFKILNSLNVLMNYTVFQGTESLNMSFARAVYVENSNLTMVCCHFERNIGCDGGALYATAASNLTIDDCVFLSNEANGLGRGGAIFAQDSTMVVIHSTFIGNLAMTNASQGNSFGGALYVAKGRLNLQMGNVFSNNSASHGGAVYSNSSYLSISSSALFHSNEATYVGAVYLLSITATLSGSAINFTKNSAKHSGGGLLLSRSQVVVLAITTFVGNVARIDGGAISAEESHLNLLNTSQFSGNSARRGGAIRFSTDHPQLINLSYFNISYLSLFTSNKATAIGGAVSLRNTNATLYAGNGNICFVNNSARYGGAMHLGDSQIFATAVFNGNSADKGGAILGNSDQQVILVSAKFTNNTATECGGAVHIEQTMNTFYFIRVWAIRNSGSALCIRKGRVVFNGTTYISENTGRLGGGMVVYSRNLVSFTGHTLFIGNRAFTGGALYTFVGVELNFLGLTRFERNTADTNGGAICALASDITFLSPIGLGINRIAFIKNSAANGGALYLDSGSSLRLHPIVKLSTSHNYAFKHGGVIYHEDSPTPIQCAYEDQRGEAEVNKLPYCFMDIASYAVAVPGSYTIQSRNDSSQNGGFIYGGLLDRCQFDLATFTRLGQVSLHTWVKEHFQDGKKHAVTSQPYQLCFCDGDQYDCSGIKSVTAQRGQKFSLSLIALDQLRISTLTQITAQTHPTGRLKFNQSIQTLPANCSDLSYAMYSAAEGEELTLYPDGPCHDTGLAKAVVNVTLLPCPDGFVQSGEECVCEDRLKEHDAACIIDGGIHIVREAGATFWLNGSYANNSYQGLILHENCPVGYCKDVALHLTLENPDVQCANDRGGMLCGACAANYSLMLGSSRCGECSNTYLALVFPFAAVGIVLVIFLSVLRLTVASGVANSVVLYANIVQVNKSVFLPVHEANVLTVFIAWINLDLGIETCFYDGMTAYAQVWLQFIFPVYVWILMTLIIVTSRYSITMSKLIGHDPIAVLATLLLMSYNKILKTFIDVYSFAGLSYPRHKMTVWLKDGNLPYMQSWHLLLAVATSIVLVFLFLPYTLLLLVGYKLYPLSNNKFFRWMYKFKPFLDSYYAPYKKSTRFWTGSLLLVRCVLYISFSFHQRMVSSLVLITTFTALILLGWSLKWVYERLHIIVIEFSIYFNIVALSVATLVHINSAPLAFSLIGLVFVTTLGIIAYNFHVFYTSKSSAWLKIVGRISSLKKKPNPSPLDIPASHDQHKIVTRTIITLREPLLDN